MFGCHNSSLSLLNEYGNNYFDRIVLARFFIKIGNYGIGMSLQCKQQNNIITNN